MYFYFFWNERLTSTGHALFTFAFFSLFFVWAPGAYAVKALLLLCASILIVGIFSRLPLRKISVNSIDVRPVEEGSVAKISAQIYADKNFHAIKLGSYRMHPSLKYLPDFHWNSLNKNESKELFANVKTSRRGAFVLPNVAVYEPDSMGISTILQKATCKCELLVYPSVIKISDFTFLTYGNSGRAFAPYFTPSIQRGTDFIGIREYREGDSLRDLHHQSFARFGKPFTKEFAKERGKGIILLLDISCTKFFEKARVENAVRLTAGIAKFLLDKNILGRFFIGNEEISFSKVRSLPTILEALARAPYPELSHPYPKPFTWAPAHRPMEPVLSVSVLPLTSKLITKQIIVADLELKTDNALFLKNSMLKTEITL